MKMRIITLVLVGFVAYTTQSCNSCSDKNNDPIPEQTPEVTVEENTMQYDNADGSESTPTDSNTNMSSGSSSTGNSATQTKATTASQTAKSGKPGRLSPVVREYSAPNGTDAENHDGDPYTKHDTTSMPTGTSIR